LLHIPIYKKILSYLYPVRIAKAATPHNSVLELCLSNGQFQLATHDALYSDGDRYRPLTIAFNHLGAALYNVKRVLVLGTGLGSAAQILYAKGYKPSYTFVEYDNTILQWAMQTLPADVVAKSIPICADALLFINDYKQEHDILVVDIFNSRVVPAFVTTEDFLKKCRRCIKPGGHFVLNYIVLNNTDWTTVEQNIKSVFPNLTILENGINRIMIATV